MALPPSFGQPGVSVSYQPKSLITNDGKSRCPVITVDVPPASIHHIFAHRQWRAGMLMSDALVTGAFDVQDAAVLELGAGTGMPCITACHLGEAKIVVCTDYDEQELVRVLKANIRANLPADPLKARLIKGVGHIWGKNIDDLLDTLPRSVDRFDVVLLADCLWDPLNHADLLKSVTAVLAHSSTARVHVIAGLHTGREKITSFLRRAFRLGLVLAPVSHPAVWPAMSPTYPLDSTPSADPVFAFATDRILELEVCGSADTADDQPRLTGMRRPFLVNGYGAAEEEVQKRNCWLTCFALRRFLSTQSNHVVRRTIVPQRMFSTTTPPRWSYKILAEYEGPLAKTFFRLKVFSLGSFALAHVLTPVLLFAPGDVSMAGRIGLCFTALATSGLSTMLIGWTGLPYVGVMRLLKPDEGQNARLEMTTLTWRLQSRRTIIYDPTMIRPTSRPFATWELTNKAPAITLPPGEKEITKLVAETFDGKTGNSVGKWMVKYTPNHSQTTTIGKPARYFNVHEDLLDEEWQILG